MKRERLLLISNKENLEDIESHVQIDEDLSQWQETSSKSDGADEIALERSEAGRIQLLKRLRHVELKRLLSQLAMHMGDLQGSIAQTAEISHAIKRAGSNLVDGLYDPLKD
ncbi:hypothetical protein MMC29_004458, partial [Sticta canariensis]|nr:hypothetical protein [Sticta canariensis]